MFISDEAGTDALPMRFAAAAILLSILIALSAAALTDFFKHARIDCFSADLAAVEARASTIYQQGGARDLSNPMDNTGTKETILFTVPGQIETVVFGSMPHYNNDMPDSGSPFENNVIYYTTYEGVTTTITSSACYADVDHPDNPIILTPGSYELTIELVKDSTKTFITLY